MQRYAEFSPTAFDNAGAFLPERAEWLVVPAMQTRDSGPFDQSNFAAALALLGGESDNVEVHRFGHWGPGWYEIILVAPGTPEAAEAESIERRLEDYPVLDEDDFSERESDTAAESWSFWGESDFLGYVQKFTDCADAALDVLKTGDTFHAYCELANEPYYCESGGVCFPCLESAAGKIDRDTLAREVRRLRRRSTAGCANG